MWLVAKWRPAKRSFFGEATAKNSVDHDVWAACFSTDGRTLFAAFGRRIERWDVETRQRKTLAVMDSDVQALAVSPTGKRLACLDSGGGVGVIDPSSGRREPHTRIESKNALRLAFGPNDRLAVVSRARVEIWAVPPLGKPRPLASYEGHGSLTYQALFSPDGALLATCSKDQTIKLWRVP